MIGLRDLNLEIPEIVEDGNSPLENAVKKAQGYYEVFSKKCKGKASFRQ